MGLAMGQSVHQAGRQASNQAGGWTGTHQAYRTLSTAENGTWNDITYLLFTLRAIQGVPLFGLGKYPVVW